MACLDREADRGRRESESLAIKTRPPHERAGVSTREIGGRRPRVVDACVTVRRRSSASATGTVGACGSAVRPNGDRGCADRRPSARQSIAATRIHNGDGGSGGAGGGGWLGGGAPSLAGGGGGAGVPRSAGDARDPDREAGLSRLDHRGRQQGCVTLLGLGSTRGSRGSRSASSRRFRAISRSRTACTKTDHVAPRIDQRHDGVLDLRASRAARSGGSADQRTAKGARRRGGRPPGA